MTIWNKNVRMGDSTLGVAVEDPWMHLHVFVGLESIPAIARMAIVVNNDVNIQQILVLIMIISVVVNQDIEEAAAEFNLSGRLPEQTNVGLVLI
jgi:hypothetical protein